MNDTDNIFINKILDKHMLAKKDNCIKYIGFLDMYQSSLAIATLKKNNIEDFVLYGGFEEAERKVLFFNTTDKEFVRDNFFSVVSLKSNSPCDYSHRNYLGAVIKCNLDRSLVGDINVLENGAHFVTLKENADILLECLPHLERFKDFVFEVKDISKLQYREIKIESTNIIIPSYRIDNFVSDLAHTSRSKASNLISAGRVFLNGTLVTKQSKEVKLGDIITIRRKGRFVFKDDLGLSRSKKHIVKIDQYV